MTGGTCKSTYKTCRCINGCNVTQFDISEEALENCKRHHQGYVPAFRAACPSFSDEDIKAGLARIRYSSDLQSAAQDAELVTESVPEVLEIKQQVYADLNRFCPDHTIFTTNTSTMPPSAIAPSTGRPERFLAVHYAIGIWGSPIAEVMKHEGTDDAVFDQVAAFVESKGLIPIKLEKEQPGYITNTLVVPWTFAAMTLVVNGVSSHQDVDRTWMICFKGSPLGPIGILDQVGFEVARNVLRMQAAAEPNNPQHQKSIDYLEEHFISKGYTGALSGWGFYSYPNPEYLEPDFLKSAKE